MCFNNYSFGWQLLLCQLLLCFNDCYVLKISDIYVDNAINNKKRVNFRNSRQQLSLLSVLLRVLGYSWVHQGQCFACMHLLRVLGYSWVHQASALHACVLNK